MHRWVLATVIGTLVIGALGCADAPNPDAPTSTAAVGSNGVQTGAAASSSSPIVPNATRSSCRSDGSAPTITHLSASPNVLWPPNHKMIEVAVHVSATDNCDSSPSCKITKVTSD